MNRNYYHKGLKDPLVPISFLVLAAFINFQARTCCYLEKQRTAETRTYNLSVLETALSGIT